MKKLITLIIALSMCCVCALSFGGCITFEFGGAVVDYSRLVLKDSDGGFMVYSYEYDYGSDGSFYQYFMHAEIDVAQGTYTQRKTEEDVTDVENCEVVIYGTNSDMDEVHFAEGYDGLYEVLCGEGSLIDCLGWLDGGTVVGICNVYNTSGKITIVCGSQNRIDKINHLIVFTYSADGAFDIIYSLDGAVASAYSNGTLIYLKDNNFYACDISTGEEVFLTENYALTQNTDTSSFARSLVYFNDVYAFFNLYSPVNSEWIYHRYLYNFESGNFIELTEV